MTSAQLLELPLAEIRLARTGVDDPVDWAPALSVAPSRGGRRHQQEGAGLPGGGDG